MSRHQIYWTVEKLVRRLRLIKPLVYCREVEIPPFRLLELSAGRQYASMISHTLDDSQWPELHSGDYWGRRDLEFILRSTFQIPKEWGLEKPIALYLPLGEAGDFSHPEALVYIDDQPYAACDRHHQEIFLAEKHLDGKVHTLVLVGWTGLLENNALRKLQMGTCKLVQIDPLTSELIAFTRVALGTVQQLDENEPAHVRLLNALDKAFKTLDTREPFGEPFYASVPRALKILKEGVSKSGPPANLDLIAAGHAHLDIAWLWTIEQSRQKAARTFLNVLRLMERHPDFHFSQSQPQLYDFVREDHPELFKEIQKRVKEGRWEPLGGMWVEADCNLTGAESLVRQFILGRRFFREQFGVGPESPILWLPDVFGFCANLPQLMKLAGLDYFYTIKLSWNQYNHIPYDIFYWQGLDGSRVLTYFGLTPEEADPIRSTYNAFATPEQVLGGYRRLQQKEVADAPMLMAFGHGDGGGGPTGEMVENLEIMRAFSALPRVRMDKAINFFKELEQQAKDDLPIWNGELYFELHRGTYTSQARNKQLNRQCEFQLHDAEFLASWASVLDHSYHYPHQELNRAWHWMCLNQFHDILPGSSIGEVYIQSGLRYHQVKEITTGVKENALKIICAHFGGEVLVINPTSFERSDLIHLIKPWDEKNNLTNASGGILYTQPSNQRKWLDVGEMAPYSAQVLKKSGVSAKLPSNEFIVKTRVLENDCLHVELNTSGDITHIYDKRNHREVLPQGTIGNQWQAFEDRPLEWDAWDVDIFYEDKVWYAEPAQSIKVIERGPLHATLEIKRQILNSHYTQRISLSRNSPRLDFETYIDWRERHILLKTAFPVDILSPTASYEVQWGNVERPTHHNTSWDWARFETCAHKWVDLSEGGYGVSLLNDGKYGHDVYGNVIRLSLLRSPTMPDPQADQGEHIFTYCLFPHTGRFNEHTMAEAYALNDPLIFSENDRPSEAKKGSYTFVTLNPSNLVIETIKRAEDNEGIIVRLFESQRKRGIASLKLDFPVKSACFTNLHEEKGEEISVLHNELKFPYRPFQIITLKLIP